MTLTIWAQTGLKRLNTKVVVCSKERSVAHLLAGGDRVIDIACKYNNLHVLFGVGSVTASSRIN